MTKAAIMPKIEKLTPDMLEDVSKYIDYLLYINSENANNHIKTQNKRNGFGIVKGKIEIADNFNEPIDEIFEVFK